MHRLPVTSAFLLSIALLSVQAVLAQAAATAMAPVPAPETSRNFLHRLFPVLDSSTREVAAELKMGL
jgi:hypothetical protein